MDSTYTIKKYALDKVALLFLFIIALLAALFIVISKSSLKLSAPIVLQHCGLSVSVPAGNGWRTDKQWKYEENGFTLSSVFVPDSAKPVALANCRYLLAPVQTTALMHLEQKADAAGGAIEKTDQFQIDDLTIDFAHIEERRTHLETFFGTTQLPYNRRLDIEVHHIAGDTELAEQVFKSIAQSLKFKDNQLLQAGSEVVTEIKNTGLAELLYDQELQNFFLIKDAKKQPIGFTMETLIDLGPYTDLNIQGGSFFYIRGRRYQQQLTLFQSTDNLDEFIWKSQTDTGFDSSGRPGYGSLRRDESPPEHGKTGTEINLAKDGTITVRKFSRGTEENHYRPGPAAIPEVLLEQVLVRMLASGREKIIVDIIDADGTITPAFVSGGETENTAGGGAYVLELKLLDGSGFSERLYLDSQKRIFKILLRQKSLYTLERTDAESILRQFPERADYILQNN